MTEACLPARYVLPLLGERVGVRASILSDLIVAAREGRHERELFSVSLPATALCSIPDAALKKPHRPEIPRKTTYRLTLYRRCVARLKHKKLQTVSSETLAKVAGVKPTQLRKDVTYLGQFGRR